MNHTQNAVGATTNLREAVGVFHDPDSLQAAIDDLLSSGFDRRELSLIASEGAVEEKLGHRYRKVAELEDDPRVPRTAYVSLESIGDAAYLPDGLPFTPLDLSSAAIPELVAACAIDHCIGPVAHTRGGSDGGYERWRGFLDHRLASYASVRNDPLRPTAVSRMSPYLHYGQISPFRLAREAHAHGGDGAAKFLDELLVWRELAYAWCFHRADHNTLEALPAWASRTLHEHRGDPRPALRSWETLARARTGDPLWDAAQRSLLIHGELHNNVRMTWGKALMHWTQSPESCLEMLIDLNHRYALDGRDPSSYGGLLWCLGLFDRPFSPPRPVIGRVRPRPTDAHARRLDVARYAAATSRPARANATCTPTPARCSPRRPLSGSPRCSRSRARSTAVPPDRVGWLFTLTAAACNLIRLPKLLGVP